MQNDQLDEYITNHLPCFQNEDERYYKPASLCDWKSTWDFQKYDANILAHGFHQYPARFLPQLARKMLRTFTTKDSTVLDIFCGSGTTLLECRYLGIKKAIGIELNPFATFMAQTKLASCNEKDAWEALNIIRDGFNCFSFPFDIVNFKNIDFWYSKDTIKDLSKLLCVITHIKQKQLKDFFLLAFCEVARKASFTDHNGFKMYRLKSKLKDNFCPNVWVEFEKVASRNLALLKESNDMVQQNACGVQSLIQGDSRQKQQSIKENSVDFILTSPPYGDSKTTVAYGQYSRLPWQWLSGKNDIIALDNNLLGGKTQTLKSNIVEYSLTLKNQAQEITQKDNSKRINDVLSFYTDLFEVLKTTSCYLKQGGYFALVTGNRTVKGVQLKTCDIICDFAARLGFEKQDIYSRNILNKRMARRNSPTNQKGKTATTMIQENIILLKKV